MSMIRASVVPSKELMEAVTVDELVDTRHTESLQSERGSGWRRWKGVCVCEWLSLCVSVYAVS